MDPHSTLSQFNQRGPKSGPFSPTARFVDPQQKSTFENYARRQALKSPYAESRDAGDLSFLAQRPIATNSRVKQDEHFKKDMYIAFVSKALQEKLSGQTKDFDDLVDQLGLKKSQGTAASSSQLRLWILALSHVLSRLERRHAPLVEAIVNLPWTAMDTAFVKSYTVFIGMLISARPEYLSLVLGKISQDLTYQSGLQALNASGPESSDSPLTRRDTYDRIHSLLSHLLSLVPTLPSTLQPLLVRNFPHKRQSQAAQVTYIRNLLRVTEYCSELTDRILALIIDRALQIDVEIQGELEELEEDVTAENGDIFEFDPFDVVVGQEDNEFDDGDEEGSGADSDFSSDESDDGGGNRPDLPANAQYIQDMVNKLDTILKLVLDHFNRLHAETLTVVSPTSMVHSSLLSPTFDITPPSSPILMSLESGRIVRSTQFQMLLAIFDRTIIRTFKSRYTQFLIFWYSSLDPEFSDLFQGLLVEKALLGQDVPEVTRAAAASYIGSFVSRAQFVDREATRRIVGVLCAFLRSHLDTFDGIVQAGGEPPGATHHGLFYAISQAVFLIFCFRWRDLQEEFDEAEEYRVQRTWMSELDVVQRAIRSPLNPLKVCSTNVVMQFARVARATDFIYCYSILQANKRGEYQTGGGGDTPEPEIHAFFPFDPYRLPRSSSYIQGVYREWSSVAIDDDGEDDDEDEGDENDEDNDGGAMEPEGDAGEYHGSHASRTETRPAFTGALGISGQSRLGSDADSLGDSFGGMSISPAQPLMVS